MPLSLANFAQEQLAQAIHKGQKRQLGEVVREQGAYVWKNGRKLLSFSCNDYLGLSIHHKVKQAAMDAVDKYGVGSGASRLISGNNPLYSKLEESLAKIKKTEASLVFSSGYMANIGIIPAMVGRGDLIIADKFIHSSIVDGCLLSGAKLLRFKHNDVESCDRLFQKYRKKFNNCLIITEHVFSMDGDIGPIDELYDLSQKHGAWLMTDDAHGLGTVPVTYKNRPHLQMGTLSKAVGSYGGYVCADRVIIEYLLNKARSLIYSTALPPCSLAASIAALEIMQQQPQLCAKPLHNAKLFTRLLGLPEATSQIVPVIIGEALQTVALSNKLEHEGFMVAPIRPPTVPKGISRLRVAFSALHERVDIEIFVRAMSAV